jgi:hypothetical protein
VKRPPRKPSTDRKPADGNPPRRKSAKTPRTRESGAGRGRPSILQGALESFSSELDADVVTDVLSWRDHPELGRVLAALESHTSRKSFFDTYAEAVVARHLVERGCELRFEVPTPAGRRSDFEVALGPHCFYLHVKRLDTDVTSHRRLTVPARLRSLERIARPYVVQLRWQEGATATQMQRLVTQAGEFISHAHIGDELLARDHDGREIGGVRIIAPSAHGHVTVTIGLPRGFVDQTPRFRRLMHRAHQQFMPKAVNVLLICGGHEDDMMDFESALLGSHIERWDAFPPRGRRVAHGRAADGFWADRRCANSKHACWFLIDGDSLTAQSRVWMRHETSDPTSVDALIRSLLDSPGDDDVRTPL